MGNWWRREEGGGGGGGGGGNRVRIHILCVGLSIAIVQFEVLIMMNLAMQ